MDNEKPIVAVNLPSTGKGGGPYVSTNRIISSNLKEKYKFRIIHYRTEQGRGISIKRIKDLMRQIDQIKPDIVHFSGLLLSGFHMALACKLCGIKRSLVTVRGFSSDAIYFNIFKKILVGYFFEPLTLLLTKRLYANSEYSSKRKLIQLFKYKSFGAVYNFPPKKSVENKSLRTELGISKEDVVVVTVARITKDKGYHIFDEVILKFSYLENVKFIIVGVGDYLEDMKRKLSIMYNNKQVFFLGYREDVQQINNDCDIFVLPTLHETLSLALLEASVSGIALIGSNTGGVPEIIENGHNGLLVEPGNVNSLYDALNTLIYNKEKRMVFGENAKKKINTKFSKERIEDKIDNIYKKLLNIK